MNLSRIRFLLIFSAVVLLFLKSSFLKAQTTPDPLALTGPQNHSSANTADNPSLPEAPKPFFSRLVEAYRGDWNSATQTATPDPVPDPIRRGYPAPLDSTPFPSSDYSVGGTPVIGAPDTQTYPLMEAINQNRSRTKIYGWFNGGFNVSTSNKGDG